MRKLYALLTGLCIGLVSSIAVAQVNPTPDSCRADFEKLNISSSANPLTTVFKALPWHSSNNRPIRICWEFGDGTDTCIQYSNTNPGPYTVAHTYAAAGVYQVCVKILYQGGCLANKCKPVQIGPLPDSCRADFERIPVTVNNPLLVGFKALPWHNNNKKPARICWDFGDGNDTCINYTNTYTGNYAVTHRYLQAGNYEVCVKILYAGGCEARKCKHLQVGPLPDSCRADFERLPSTVLTPLLVSFKALPWHNNNKKPSRICWTFGDGRDTCINYPNSYTGTYGVRHVYEHPGLYEVCVKILYYGGCEARKCERVQVGPPDICSANFEKLPLTSVNDPLHAIFKALPQHNNNRKPARICWDFGDGNDTCINYPANYNGQYLVAHRYTHPGNYEVCVKILYYGGCEARKCKHVVIPPIPTTCSVRVFEITPSINSLVRGFLAVPHSLQNRRPIRICWEFGDGTDTCITLTNTTPNPNPLNLLIRHTFPGPGVYRVCAKVLFEGGCVARDCEEVVIRNPSNVCGGFMVDSMIAPRSFKFKAFSINNPNDEVISYRWTFGDGTSAIGREVTHTYNTAGTFEVCLYIKTRLGCETRICKPVRVPGNNTPTLVLHPNPVVTTLNANFFSTHSEIVNIRILNGTGTVVRTYSRNANVGPNTWSFELAALTPGIYSFVVQSPNQLASAIFIKQ